MRELSRGKDSFLIAALVLMWGSGWPIYKIALAYTPPILFAGMRLLLGGLLTTIVIAPRYRLIRWRQTWPIYTISAFFNAILFYGLQSIGLQYVPEGLFTVIVYLQPMIVGLFAWLILKERLTLGKGIGLIIGFVGVGVISYSSLTGNISLVGVAIAILTAVSWAFGIVYVKIASGSIDAFWLVALQSVIGGLVMTVLGLGVEHWSSIVWNFPYWSGLIYGAVFGIPVPWAMFYVLVQANDASRVASYTFLVPFLAVLYGVLFMHEPLSLDLFIGFVMIMASIYLVNRPI